MLRHRLLKIFIAAIFSLALLLPIFTQTFHALQGHKHEVCVDFSSHLHEKQLDCSICDFHHSNFDFKLYNYSELIVFSTFHKVESVVVLIDSTSLISHYYLRGPPRLS